MVGEVNRESVEAVGDRRARRAAGGVVGSEHVVIHQELRAPAKQVSQRGLSFLSLESVILVDPHPRQFPSLARQIVAAASVLLLGGEQLDPRSQPLFAGSGLLLSHRSSPLAASFARSDSPST